jgi:hypothetical protein
MAILDLGGLARQRDLVPLSRLLSSRRRSSPGCRRA